MWGLDDPLMPLGELAKGTNKSDRTEKKREGNGMKEMGDERAGYESREVGSFVL